jgi:hypothetical protein
VANAWGERTYGEPCRECGFWWSASLAESIGVVARAPSSFAAVLAGASGRERHPALGWSVAEYVLHVGDNLRIWAERVAGITGGDPPRVASYDENVLASARAYAAVGLHAAEWSLGTAARDWVDAMRAAPPDLVMEHPERGAMGLEQVASGNAHDALHHLFDVRRSLAG